MHQSRNMAALTVLLVDKGPGVNKIYGFSGSLIVLIIESLILNLVYTKNSICHLKLSRDFLSVLHMGLLSMILSGCDKITICFNIKFKLLLAVYHQIMVDQ